MCRWKKEESLDFQATAAATHSNLMAIVFNSGYDSFVRLRLCPSLIFFVAVAHSAIHKRTGPKLKAIGWNIYNIVLWHDFVVISYTKR
ncbi:predicted protein [Arabidopsis lyrata subsp. lyrata]|uniref:Predicted protein n=1 Tax=Arabidopsis lyrata subsp. lyrata TaxID=81972 RepID=D7KHM9_ARALL|nr:predicted protein [Arabidopsis lyrata subsp. lyrata]